VGVSPAFVNRMYVHLTLLVHSRPDKHIFHRANSAKTLPETTAAEIRFSRIYCRFYTALQLRDLCNEVPVHAVARKYHVTRGSVQNLIQISEGFAAGLIQFCDKMGWGMLKAALEHMFDRLKAGARADLLELAKVPFVKSRTARVFWEHGLKAVASVAEAEAKDLVPILLMVCVHSGRKLGPSQTS
jgi:replicative superfamily II helicase